MPGRFQIKSIEDLNEEFSFLLYEMARKVGTERDNNVNRKSEKPFKNYKQKSIWRFLN